MRTAIRRHLAVAALAFPMLVAVPGKAEAQRHPNRTRVEVTAGITFSVTQRESIRSYYADHPRAGLKALPPGMRKRLAKGKPLPPGIAKQVAPSALMERVAVPKGYRLQEVGPDVVLVEIATGIVHDILMDVIHRGSP